MLATLVAPLSGPPSVLVLFALLCPAFFCRYLFFAISYHSHLTLVLFFSLRRSVLFRGLSSAAASGASDASSAAVPRKLVIFGGSGFVGSKACEVAVAQGFKVVSVSRKGRPAHAAAGGWGDQVTWLKADLLAHEKKPGPAAGSGTEASSTDPSTPLSSPAEWELALAGACGAASTVGMIGSAAAAYRGCGEANVRAILAAREAGVPRFSLISVHDFAGLPASWRVKEQLLKGYFQGKADSEVELFETYPVTGVALRPGYIAGARPKAAPSSPKDGDAASSSSSSSPAPPPSLFAPLNLLSRPWAALATSLPASAESVPLLGLFAVPPVPVEAVAAALIDAATNDDVKGGVMDVWEIAKYEK